MCIACLNFFPLFSSDLPQPYSLIKILPEYHFSGYFLNESQLSEIFSKNDIRVVLEVGSWIGGGSTKYMGELLKQKKGTQKKGKQKKFLLYAVDHWLGSSTQQPNEVHWQSVLDCVYQQFLSNMIHWKLTDVVIPCRMKSQEAAASLNVVPDLIYIDGEHTTEAVIEDLKLWYPFVKNRGILCGDDWIWDSVRIAVTIFATENNLDIEASGNFWRLHEK